MVVSAHNSIQGSVFWMAPEVINSKKKGYNSKIDIWSFGCVMFDMWMGERPWSGREAAAVLLHVCTGSVLPIVWAVVAEPTLLALPNKSRPSVSRGCYFVSSGRRFS